MTGAFEYNPMVMADHIQMLQTTSAALDDIENRAQTALSHVRGFWDSQGTTAYEDASQIIHQGVQQGRDTINHQGHVTDLSHQDAIGTDMGAANSISAF